MVDYNSLANSEGAIGEEDVLVSLRFMPLRAYSFKIQSSKIASSNRCLLITTEVRTLPLSLLRIGSALS